MVCREVFNKNVEIYDRQSVKAPQPLRFTSNGGSCKFDIPVVRISYHGKNHYNSLTTSAFKPLGDGKDSPISFVKSRKEQEKKEDKLMKELKLQGDASIHKLKMENSQLSREAQRSLLGLLKEIDPELGKVLPPADFDHLWKECSIRGGDFMLGIAIEAFVGNLLKHIHERRLKTTENQQHETKVYKMVRHCIKDVANEALQGVRTSGTNKRIKKSDFEPYLYQTMLPDALWRLAK